MRALVLLMMVGCTDGANIDDPSTDSDVSSGTDAEGDTEGEAGTDADTDSEIEADTDAPAPLVNNGTYDTSGFVVDSDPCMLGNFRDVNEFLPTELVITNSSATSFSMGEPNGTSQVCTVSGSDYTCGRFQQVEDSGFSADLILDTGLSGTILSPDALDGVLDFDMTCSGGGCTILELTLTFPCAFEGSFDLDLQ